MGWVDVVGYEGIYEVSRCGNIRTKEGKTTYSKLHGKRKWKQRILKQKVSKDNTCRVSLWKDGKERTWLVHRVVAKAYIPMVKGKDYINHIDGNRQNNCVENLEWCNHKENNNHAFDTGLMTSNKRIVLVSKDENKVYYFRSLAKASLFLGKNEGYLSGMFGREKYELENYYVFQEVNGVTK